MNRLLISFLVSFFVGMICAVIGGVVMMGNPNSQVHEYRASASTTCTPPITQGQIQTNKTIRALYNISSNEALEPKAEELENKPIKLGMKSIDQTSITEFYVVAHEPQIAADLANSIVIAFKTRAEALEGFGHTIQIVEAATTPKAPYNTGNSKALLTGGIGGGLTGGILSFIVCLVILKRREGK